MNQQPIDAIEAEVLRYGLAGVADEMRVALVRGAFSPIVYEGQDFAAALYDRNVRLLAQGQTLPLFQGTLDVCINAALTRLGGIENLHAGDIVLMNYPWDTGSHSNDMALVAPAFIGKEHVGYSVVKTHHMDIGAMRPGVSTEAQDTWQEGTLYPAVKIYKAGKRDEDLYRLMMMNSRTPHLLDGDLGAQIGAIRLGLQGLERLIERHGLERFESSVKAIFAHGEHHMRQLIGTLPNGRFTASGAHDGGSAGLTAPAAYEIAIEINDHDVTVDLTNAAPQAPGAINAPRASVVSAVRAAIMAFAGAGEIANHGHFLPITVRTKPGTIFDPLPGAAVGMYGFPLIQAMDVVYQALQNAVPGSVPAAGSDVSGFAMWGLRQNGDFWGGATHFCGGQGASKQYGDGGSSVMHIAASGVRSSSLEAWENAIPVLVTKCEYAPNSQGAGQFQGTPGMSIQMKTLAEMEVTSIFERTQIAPFGLEGGEAGRPNQLRLRYPDGRVEIISRANRIVPAGTLIDIELSGGGGFGALKERSAAAIKEDLRNEIVTREWVAEKYPQFA